MLARLSSRASVPSRPIRRSSSGSHCQPVMISICGNAFSPNRRKGLLMLALALFLPVI